MNSPVPRANPTGTQSRRPGRPRLKAMLATPRETVSTPASSQPPSRSPATTPDSAATISGAVPRASG